MFILWCALSLAWYLTSILCAKLCLVREINIWLVGAVWHGVCDSGNRAKVVAYGVIYMCACGVMLARELCSKMCAILWRMPACC